MLVTCPECQTAFNAGAEQLRAAGGRLRCGQCGAVFDALERRSESRSVHFAVTGQAAAPPEREEPPPAEVPPEEYTARPAPEASERASGPDAPTGDTGADDGDWSHFSEAHIETLLRPGEAGEIPDEGPVRPHADAYHTLDDLDIGLEPSFGPMDPEPEPGPASASDDGKEAVEPPEERPVPVPSGAPTGTPDSDPPTAERSPAPPAHERFDEILGGADREADDELPIQFQETARPNRGWLATGLWGIGALLMTGLLGVQYAYFHSYELAGRPGWRPYLEQLCEPTGCRLPLRRDLAAVELADHTIQSHPRRPDALLITATLFNRANFVQPYPDVEVVMMDIEQRPVASRRFHAAEYLTEAAVKRPFVAGGEAHLMLEVVDPGKEAVSFEFNFY